MTEFRAGQKKYGVLVFVISALLAVRVPVAQWLERPKYKSNSKGRELKYLSQFVVTRASPSNV